MKRFRAELEDLRCERDVLVNNFLIQEDTEKEKNELIRVLMADCREMEAELDRLSKQEQSLNRTIITLTLERDVRVREELLQLI